MKNFSLLTFLRKNRAFLLFVVFYLFFRTGYADWSYVPSESMEPTLYPGDVLWIDKTAFGPTVPFLNKQIVNWGQPLRGDIITFVPPHTSKLLVKRVMAVPGDKIRIEANRIYINGELLEQRVTDNSDDSVIGTEYIKHKDHRFKLSKAAMIPYFGQTIAVPEGKYFVMGDFRNNSSDSRFWGFVDQEKIMGKVTSIALSFSKQRDISSRVAFSID